MTTSTRLPRTPASDQAARHPLDTREKRTPVNYALRARGIPAKACSICWVIKSTSQFNKKARASDGLDPHCRACNSARHADRKANDPAYSQRHRDSARMSARKRYQVRREVIREQFRKRRAGYVAANATRVKDPNVLRRCAGQCGQLLPETEFRLNRGVKDGLRSRCNQCADACKRARRVCLEAYGDPLGQVCYLCGHQITVKSEAWVDHVIPQSQGGPDTVDNVRWTHDVCNIRRQNWPLTPEQLRRFNETALALPGEAQ
ncbi:HNH endonuclease [Streptomyces pilosus]|uniref:HNH endonuclease n=1 Tax=Streptomyces pilosus TaxID=28893 RepID=UPI00363DEBB6